MHKAARGSSPSSPPRSAASIITPDGRRMLLSAEPHSLHQCRIHRKLALSLLRVPSLLLVSNAGMAAVAASDAERRRAEGGGWRLPQPQSPTPRRVLVPTPHHHHHHQHPEKALQIVPAMAKGMTPGFVLECIVREKKTAVCGVRGCVAMMASENGSMSERTSICHALGKGNARLEQDPMAH